MIGNKKVTALGHQPRKATIGDKRPSPSQQSAAVKPTQPAQDGMAIRDKFAADYIQQLNVWPEGDAMEQHAKRAYEYADMMMKARKD